MYIRFGLILMAAALLIASCSNEKQEEAQRLEQEMMGQESAADTTGDSMVSEEPMPMDTEMEVGDVDAVPDEDVPELPSQPMTSGFVVQVAACESVDYATYLIDLYKKRGYEPFVATYTIGDQLYYRVRLGVFETRAEAQKLQLELKDKYSLDAWIDAT